MSTGGEEWDGIIPMCFRLFIKFTGLMYRRNDVPKIHVNPVFKGKSKCLEFVEKHC